MNSDQQTAKPVKGILYYDIISPFSYFYIKQRHRFNKQVDIQPVPILVGGLFRATDNRGPGEIDAKRAHTYQYCVWLAEKLGLPFRFPEHHPFLTVAAQRLLVQQNAQWEMIERAFEYIWVEGKDPNLSWSDFCQYLDLAIDTPKPDSPDVKAKLIANTELAKADGAFGVPTLILNGHAFWGVDTIDWALDYLNKPSMFEQAAYLYAGQVPKGL